MRFSFKFLISFVLDHKRNENIQLQCLSRFLIRRGFKLYFENGRDATYFLFRFQTALPLLIK